MTDFIEKLHGHITNTPDRARFPPSDITRLSLTFINEELGAQEKQFQKKLGKMGEKARERMGVFGEQLKASHEKIMDVLETVQELMFLWEETGNDRDRIAKTLKMRIDYSKHKSKVLEMQYPIAQQAQQEKEYEFSEEFPSNSIIKCHTHHSSQPCTPENDQILDQQLKNSIKDLYLSLEQTLTSFQTNYGHEIDEHTIELVTVLRQEYQLAWNEIDSSPSWEQIQNIKELEMMVRATIQQKIYGIRQRQRQIEDGMQRQANFH